MFKVWVIRFAYVFTSSHDNYISSLEVVTTTLTGGYKHANTDQNLFRYYDITPVTYESVGI